jgi:NADPH2:quinone reductase
VEHGCDTEEDFAARVHAITGGNGVPVVYDSVGRTTFEGSLRCLQPRGLLASFGEASGHPDPMPPRRLGQLGSLFLTHPSLSDYIPTREAFTRAAGDLFTMVATGKIRIEIGGTYPLAEAARAHRDLEERGPPVPSC